GEKSVALPRQHRGSVLALAFSPDELHFLSGSADGTARLWDAVTGQPLGPPWHHAGGVWAVAFAPDGRAALTRDELGWRVWDVTTGLPAGPVVRRVPQALEHALPPEGRQLLALSPDGRRVLTQDEDGLARLRSLPLPLPDDAK